MNTSLNMEAEDRDNSNHFIIRWQNLMDFSEVQTLPWIMIFSSAAAALTTVGKFAFFFSDS